jgi:hypothetical protein
VHSISAVSREKTFYSGTSALSSATAALQISHLASISAGADCSGIAGERAAELQGNCSGNRTAAALRPSSCKFAEKE